VQLVGRPQAIAEMRYGRMPPKSQQTSGPARKTGRLAVVFDEEDLVCLLKAAVEPRRIQSVKWLCAVTPPPLAPAVPGHGAAMQAPNVAELLDAKELAVSRWPRSM